MKKILLLITSFAFVSIVSSQSIERSLTGNAGETYSANNSFLTFAIGEAVILPSPSGTFSPFSNASMYTIGFIQPHVATTGAILNSYNWVSAYPNPTTGWVRLDIHGDNFQVNNVRILNVQGQAVSTKPFKMVNGKIDLDLTNLNAGVYFIAVTDSKIGRVVTTKLIKQNK
jgi:hypothetical protein